MLKGTYRFCCNICCHPDDAFFKDVLLLSARQSQATFCMLRQCGPRLACLQSRPVFHWLCVTMGPQSVEQLKFYSKNVKEFQFSKLQQLVSSFPTCLLMAVKRKGDVPRQTCPCPNILETCCRHQIVQICTVSYMSKKDLGNQQSGDIGI